MSKRNRENLMRMLPAFVATLAIVLSPLAEAQAQRQWRLFPNLLNRGTVEATATSSRMVCDPVTGECNVVQRTRTVQRPVPQARVPYEGYTTTTTSEGSTGGVGSTASTGGTGAYAVIRLNPGERLLSVRDTTSSQKTAVASMEDGSLLDEIMDKLADDPDWRPGPDDGELLKAAFDFLEAFSEKSRSGALQATSLDPDRPKSVMNEKPNKNESLRGRISWVGPPRSDKASLVSTRLSWSPPTLLAFAGD